MADDIRCDEVVERIRLAAVPGVEETPDYSLVLLRCCGDGEAPLLSFLGSPGQVGQRRDARELGTTVGTSSNHQRR
jgi:hypothetical protein